MYDESDPGRHPASLPASPRGDQEPAARVAALSTRQREVLELIARGLSNKQIGTELGISTETVRTHTTAVLERLGVGNRTEAAMAYVAGHGRPGPVARVPVPATVAVLPLVTWPDDPTAPMTAMAITRELTTLLARRELQVIAIAATGDPRALGHTSQELGRVLEARFLIDGMLRLSDHRWRLALSVVDATTGRCVWAERYDIPDGRLTDQDDVCATIVDAVYPRLVAIVKADHPVPPARSSVIAWTAGQSVDGARLADAHGTR
jgi:TolB-like protein